MTAAFPPPSLAARPLSEWHEDIGPVLWWRFPIEEPPYVGTPLDSGAPVTVRLEFMGETKYAGTIRPGGWPGYHTHWTPLVLPEAPEDAAIATLERPQEGENAET